MDTALAAVHTTLVTYKCNVRMARKVHFCKVNLQINPSQYRYRASVRRDIDLFSRLNRIAHSPLGHQRSFIFIVYLLYVYNLH